MNREALAESMIPMIGKLYRDKSVVTSIYSRQLVNQSVIDILKAHKFVRQLANEPLAVEETYPILEAISAMELYPSRIDLGKLATKYKRDGNGQSLEEFLKAELSDALSADRSPQFKPRDVVLYGFGRIGRLVARLLVEKAGGGDALRLRAIVVRKGKAENDLQKRASLLRRDSVHGPFRGTISVDQEHDALIINGNYVKVIYANSPSEVDYTEYGIDDAIVVDNTGVWRDEAGLDQHVACTGGSQALLTAPGKGDIK
ncbi:MAG: glyceraldehyde-3-phosphate dehydrogenase, partial [Pseudomonadales bacterium]|nr:glyceraldehyde-3-phosphate dehydrogenase [Pseudomonadales bacterium]